MHKGNHREGGFGLEERIDFPVGESIQCRTKSAPRVEVLGRGGLRVAAA